MTDEVKDAQQAEDKELGTGNGAPAKEDATVGNLFNKSEHKDPRLVPEGVLIAEKKARKEAERKLEELEKSGASSKEIDKTLDGIADTYGVDKNFVSDIASVVKSNTEKDLDERIASKMKPFEEKEHKEQSKKLFNEAFDKAVDNLGAEYKSVANKSTIEALAREAASDPDRKDLTLEQILQGAYGHLVKGTKKPVEGIRPKDGGSSMSIDYNRAKTDTEYYQEIMADPATKAEYNKDLAKRNRL